MPKNGASSTPRIKWVWAPQEGPQHALVTCPLPEIFFGGARGGGKTDGVLGKWALKEKRYGRAFNAMMFRRTTVASEDAIERAKQIFMPLGAKFVGAPQAKFRMPNGGRIGFSYLDNITDAQAQQGKNLTDVWVEEAGQYPAPDPIDILFGALRSAEGVPVQMILTGNPGGAGQIWLAERYGLIPFPNGPKIVTRKLANGNEHKAAVIPSRITDNKIMLTADPGYLDRLQLVGSPQLVKAWVDGDWSAIEGAFFPEWQQTKHVIEPFEIPQHWTRIVGFDWGSASPFSVGWWAVVSDDTHRPEGVLPRGALVRYREWYGSDRPNKGLKLQNTQIAQGILEREKLRSDPKQRERIELRVADPAIFAEDGGPSIAETMSAEGVTFIKADNKRVPQVGSIGGWEEMRRRLVGANGRPMLYSFSTCPAFNRQMPTLQHDPLRAEDVDTEMEDHAADEGRYVCMSRPWTAPTPKQGQKHWQDDENIDWRTA